MAYYPTASRLGLSNFTQIDTTQLFQIGTIVTGEDSSLGGGEFIYVPGVASAVVGSLVTYNPSANVTTLSPNTANNAAPVAVLMSANTATTSFGWAQIAGVAVVKKTAVKVNPAVKIYQSATSGRVMPTVASGKQITNAISVNTTTVVSATSTINVLLDRSFMQGAVL